MWYCYQSVDYFKPIFHGVELASVKHLAKEIGWSWNSSQEMMLSSSPRRSTKYMKCCDRSHSWNLF